MTDLVLSIFPGIDLLGRAFEEEGFCIVRGPDVIWGGDVRAFHPPPGVFAGVIGGPPCQSFSSMRYLVMAQGYAPRFGNLIPEWERVVSEAQPAWALMEEVPAAPVPRVEGYVTRGIMVRDMWVGGVQPRKRRISFLTPAGRPLDIEWAALMLPGSTLADGMIPSLHRQARSMLTHGGGVHGGGRREGFAGGKLPAAGAEMPIPDMCEAMGLPRDFTDRLPFTVQGKRSVLGNGVPMAMGRALARAVRRASCDAAPEILAARR